jgi:hypothetical protein
MLISRFEKWLEREGGVMDRAYRTALQDLIEARVELAMTYETAEPLTHGPYSSVSNKADDAYSPN